MSIKGIMFNIIASRNDRKRDAKIPLPNGVAEYRNISYGPQGKHHLLDISCPKGTDAPLPTIVSIHGGGYVYGSKEIYRRYCMDLARRGFAVVNFNYRLSPRWKFPAPLEDTNRVMQWICEKGEKYHLDPSRLFLVGDSAGAQLASQYAAIVSSPAYAANFDFTVPQIRLLAVGLNCGLYDQAGQAAQPRKDLNRDYLGTRISPEDPRLQVLKAIDGNYPPAYVMTACCDFLRPNAEPMAKLLEQRGIPCVYKCYGSEEQKEIAHVFHVNIALPEAQLCNDEECAFFRQYLAEAAMPASSR